MVFRGPLRDPLFSTFWKVQIRIYAQNDDFERLWEPKGSPKWLILGTCLAKNPLKTDNPEVQEPSRSRPCIDLGSFFGRCWKDFVKMWNGFCMIFRDLLTEF